MKKNTEIKIEGLSMVEIIKIFQDMKKGVYHSFTRKHVESNGYYFIKTYVGRLASYANIVGKEETNNMVSKNRITIIPNVLYYNENTQNYLLMVATTKRNHHSKTHYFDNNGNEISKEEYESVNPQKKHNPFNSPVFNLKLNEIVMVK